MSVFLQWLPKGFTGVASRRTDGAVFSVVEGSATVEAGKERYEVGPRDVFVIPPWEKYTISARSSSSECVLFSYSDRAAQEALGFWRENVES
jgi:gentisate 1,2-dioxygenase